MRNGPRWGRIEDVATVGWRSDHRAQTSIDRTDALRRLTAGRTPLAVIEAPAGYGKSTVAAAWADRDDRRSLVLSVATGDGEPLKVDPSLVAGPEPFLLVLDDVEELGTTESWAEVGTLLDRMPRGSTIALVGRQVRFEGLSRSRADGAVTDIGVPELRMAPDEVAAMALALGFVLDSDAARGLHRRTEGWPAAVVLGLRTRTGDGGPLEDYVRGEIIDPLTERERRFLSRASVLEWLSGELCAVALPWRTSARMIRSLRSSAVPLFPLEGRRWRLHPIVRDVLRAELEENEPELVAPIAARASAWCEERGFLDEAITLAQTAGDIGRVAALTVRSALVGSWLGTLPEIHRRLRWIADRVPLERYPFAAAIGAWIHINTGNATVADRLAAAAARGDPDALAPDGSPLRAWTALLRATLAHEGVEQSRADAMWALEQLSPGSPWRAPAWLIFGIGCAVSGDWAEADEALADASAEAAEDGSALTGMMALGERSLVAIRLDRWSDAEAHATRALEIGGRHGAGDSWAAGVARVGAAHVALHRGDVAAARAHLDGVADSLAHLTRAVPAVSVQVRLELARAYVSLGDADRAKRALDEADDVVRRFPKMRELASWADEIRGQLRERTDGAIRLTNAELRLLPLLATNLTFQAIADELFLSPHTVKAEAISIYRKLGQTSRGATVARAREIGLIAS
jgi:LuxR family maltose regulon positive regulatory protein